VNNKTFCLGRRVFSNVCRVGRDLRKKIGFDWGRKSCELLDEGLSKFLEDVSLAKNDGRGAVTLRGGRGKGSRGNGDERIWADFDRSWRKRCG